LVALIHRYATSDCIVSLLQASDLWLKDSPYPLCIAKEKNLRRVRGFVEA
jgi:hypothetical protein